MNRYNNYAVLGNASIPNTIAIPSNTKFISPLNNIYNKKYTSSMLYPGHEEDKTLNTSNKTNIIDKIKNKTCKSC